MNIILPSLVIAYGVVSLWVWIRDPERARLRSYRRSRADLRRALGRRR